MTSIELGHFCYKRTSNGNLLGEFSNSALKAISPESAERIPGTQDITDPAGFAGQYHATWYEEGATGVTLSVKRIDEARWTKYELTWVDDKGKTNFEGLAFLHDGLMVGAYKGV